MNGPGNGSATALRAQGSAAQTTGVTYMYERSKDRKNSARFAAVLALFFCASPGAQEAVLEEIVVTAQKREQSLQDVGLSVTAFSGERIRELGYTATTEVSQQTPGLNVIQFHPTNTTVNIRGVSQNDFADHYEPPVAVFVDNAYVSAVGGAHAQLFDIGRVEVLRGPQGTLFGRNATGGMLHYVSAAPTEELEGYGRFTVGDYATTRLEGAMSGAIAENVQARFSGSVHQSGGLLANDDGADLRDTGALALRLQLAFQPSDAFAARLKFHVAEDDSGGNAYQHDATFQNALGLSERIPDGEDFYYTGPGADFNGYRDADGDNFRGRYDETGFFERSVSGVTAELTWDLGDALSLTSISDVLSIDKRYREDVDSSPYPYFAFQTEQNFRQFSQEFRLSRAADRSHWQAGLYMLDIDDDVSSAYDLDYLPFGVGAGDFGEVVEGGFQDSTVGTASWAAFVQGEYDLSDTLTGVLGLRYTEDERTLDYLGGSRVPAWAVELTDTVTDSLAFDNVSYKAQLDWHPGEETLVYAGVTQAHKAGSFRTPVGADLDAFTPPMPTRHGEEVLRSVELGIKTTFAGGRARLNASAFQYEYDDYQAFVVDPTISLIADPDIINLDATASGAEVELSAVPADGLDLVIGVAWIDSSVRDVGYPDGETVRDSVLPYAPDVSINGLVRYEFGVGAGTAALQADFNSSDGFCFSVLCAPLDRENAYVVSNLRAEYAFPGQRWSIAAWVTNVSGEEYRIYSIDLSGLGIANDAYAPPRMFGLTANVDF